MGRDTIPQPFQDAAPDLLEELLLRRMIERDMVALLGTDVDEGPMDTEGESKDQPT